MMLLHIIYGLGPPQSKILATPMLQLTSLLEQRMRGDLIETFKIVNGFTDYGQDCFTLSSCTNHLIPRSNFLSANFFAN